MQFTKSSINYNSIAKDVKGITIISKGSVELLKAAYDGKLEDTAKLLANYMWRTTRDTTMILITAALLVLAEKNKETLKQELEELGNHKTTIKNLFVSMAKGEGSKAELYAKGSLEGIFKDIFKGTHGIDDKKVNTIWEGYTKQLKRIKPWKFSLNALVNNVAPALNLTLQPPYCDLFAKTVTNISKGTDNKLKMIQGIKGQVRYIDGAYFHFDGFICDVDTEHLPSISHDQFTVYYYVGGTTIRKNKEGKILSESLGIGVRFDKDVIIDYLAQQKISTERQFKNFLQKTVEQDLPKLREFEIEKEKKQNVKEIVRGILRNVSYDRTNDELNNNPDYYKFHTKPFIIAYNFSHIYCDSDSITCYLLEKNITEEEKIKKELDRYFDPIMEKKKFLETLPKKLSETLKPPDGYSYKFSVSNFILPRTIKTKNGLPIYYYVGENNQIEISFYDREILDKMVRQPKPENVIETLNESVEEVFSLIQAETIAESVVKQINKERKEKNLEKTSLSLRYIHMLDMRLTGEESEMMADGVKVWYATSTPKDQPETNEVYVILYSRTVLEKLLEKNCTEKHKIEEFLRDLVQKVFAQLSDRLSTKFPPIVVGGGGKT